MRARPGHAATCGVVLVVVAITMGCAAAPLHAQNDAAAPADQPAPEADALRDLAPPGLPVQRVIPRQGDDLRRASMTLDAILAELPQVAFLQPAAAPGPQPGDPPLASQQAYLQAREAWRGGRLFEARRHLAMALTMVPDDPHLLRMMGQIWAASGNVSQSTQFLEKALAADPDDVETAMLLGRQATDRGLNDQAIRIFAHVLDRQKADDEVGVMVRVLTSFYLGSALERAGYDQASIDQMRYYLSQPPTTIRSHPMARRLALLSRQGGLLWQSMGDCYLRLGQFDKALDSYGQAVEEGVGDPAGLLARRVHALLLMGNADSAGDVLVKSLLDEGLVDPPLDLSLYAVRKGVSGQRLAQSYQRVYLDRDRPARLAILIARLLGAKEAEPFLIDHLRHRPADEEVFQAILRGPDGTRTLDEPELVRQAVQQTTEAMVAAPQTAEQYAAALVEVVTDPQMLEEATRAGADDHTPAAALRRYVHARALLKLMRWQDARAELEQVVSDAPELVPGRTALATVLVAQRQYAEAEKVIDGAPGDFSPRLTALKVQILAETNRSDQAIALLDQLLEKNPNQPDLLIHKARLLVKMEQAPQAERVLLDGLNAMPTAEAIYEMLFEMYDQGSVPDPLDQYQRLMRRILGNIPQSRLARIKLAEMHKAQGDFASAERLLQSVLREDPRDPRALEQLLDTYQSANRGPDAEKLIEERLLTPPLKQELLLAALRYYVRTRNTARQFEVEERIIKLMPAGVQRMAALADVYLRWEKPQEAVTVLQQGLGGIPADAEEAPHLVGILAQALLQAGRADDADAIYEQAIKDHPKQEADIRLSWAMNLEQRGRYERGEEMMVKLLAKFPDHAPTLNALGYGWANRGRNLDRAKEMIEKALQAEPNSAAYLDSLGWVHYKLGNFNEAIRWLKQSQAAGGGDHPVILDHLGDALYRAGQRREAEGLWRQAQQGLRSPRLRVFEDPELKDLGERVQRKIEALRKNRPAPVADSAGKTVEPAVAEPPAPVEADPPAVPVAP